MDKREGDSKGGREEGRKEPHLNHSAPVFQRPRSQKEDEEVKQAREGGGGRACAHCSLDPP